MIGVIVKTKLSADEIDERWVPEAMNISDIYSTFLELIGYVPSSLEFTHNQDTCLIHFTIDSDVEPRAISFSCSASPNESNLINTLAERLDAKIYDSASCDFVLL